MSYLEQASKLAEEDDVRNKTLGREKRMSTIADFDDLTLSTGPPPMKSFE